MVPVVLTAPHWLHISVGIILLVVSVILTDPTEKLSSRFCRSHSYSCVHCRFYPFLHCLGVDLRLNLSLPFALFSFFFTLYSLLFSVFSVFSVGYRGSRMEVHSHIQPPVWVVRNRNQEPLHSFASVGLILIFLPCT
jgi:hypothetical protein